MPPKAHTLNSDPLATFHSWGLVYPNIFLQQRLPCDTARPTLPLIHLSVASYLTHSEIFMNILICLTLLLYFHNFFENLCILNYHGLNRVMGFCILEAGFHHVFTYSFIHLDACECTYFFLLKYSYFPLELSTLWNIFISLCSWGFKCVLSSILQYENPVENHNKQFK